jgi:tetratricopeptide (TPR) repeat protein
MAGLSTIGGWFGGNAMLGSAILNGISIGVVGGSAAKFAALPALGKVGVLTSVTATALDGVASFENPETQNLTYRVRLMLPVDMGSKSIRDFAKDFNALENDMQAADSKRDSKAYELLSKKKIEMANIGHKWAKQALVSKQSTNSDLIVFGVFSKNVGDFDLFEKLISRVTTSKVQDTGYVDYLRAIVSVEKGDLKTAENLLRKSFKLNPYAIEAPLLLVNMQGRNFKRNEKDIVAIVKRAQKHYDADKYESGYSLVSMYYRVGTLYLLNKKYAHAKFYYELALDKTSMLQKYFGNKQMTNMIKLGIANAMYGQNNKKNADEMFLKIINESENAGEIDFFKNQYAGSLN